MKSEWQVNGVLEWMLWRTAEVPVLRMEAGVQLSVGKESHVSPRAHPLPRSSLSPVTGCCRSTKSQALTPT